MGITWSSRAHVFPQLDDAGSTRTMIHRNEEMKQEMKQEMKFREHHYMANGDVCNNLSSDMALNTRTVLTATPTETPTGINLIPYFQCVLAIISRDSEVIF